MQMLSRTIPCSHSPRKGAETGPRSPAGLEGMEVKRLVSLLPDPGPALPGYLSFPGIATGKPAGLVEKSFFAFGPEMVSSTLQGEKG